MHSNYSIFFYHRILWGVVEPSNNVSTNSPLVDQMDGLERASPKDDGEDAGDSVMAAEDAEDSVFALVPCTKEARDSGDLVYCMEEARIN